MDEKIIELIESQAYADGFVRVDKLLRPCDKVEIPEGPLLSVLLVTVTDDATQVKNSKNF